MVFSSIRVKSDCEFSLLINLIVFNPFKMSYTISDKIMVEPYEEVVGNPHYNTSSSRSSSPVEEENPQ